jgi:alanyl-tRNA synthetase
MKKAQWLCLEKIYADSVRKFGDSKKLCGGIHWKYCEIQHFKIISEAALQNSTQNQAITGDTIHSIKSENTLAEIKETLKPSRCFKIGTSLRMIIPIKKNK